MDAIEELDARLVWRLGVLPVPIGVATLVAGARLGALDDCDDADVARSRVARNKELFEAVDHVDDMLVCLSRPPLRRWEGGRESGVIRCCGA